MNNAIYFQEIGIYIALAVCVLVGIYLFFLKSRYQRDAYELSQDIDKITANFEQIQQKYEVLAQEKNQLEQWAIQQQTKYEAVSERLSERDGQLQRFQQKSNLPNSKKISWNAILMS